MSKLLTGVNLLIDTFHKYSSKEGDKHTLSKAELKELLQNEFGDELMKASDQTAVDSIFKNLDANRDNAVDFEEYVALVCSLTMVCNEFFTCKK